MRMTIDIDAQLLTRASTLAAARGITLEALIEESLEALTSVSATPARRPFVLHTFGAGGLTAEAEAMGLHRAMIESYDT